MSIVPIRTIQPVKCKHCGNEIKGMADSQLVGPRKDIVCKDAQACAKRRQEHDRKAHR
jgi:hypothetical protein